MDKEEQILNSLASLRSVLEKSEPKKKSIQEYLTLIISGVAIISSIATGFAVMKEPYNDQDIRITTAEFKNERLAEHVLGMEKFLWNHYRTPDDRLYLRNPALYRWSSKRGGNTFNFNRPKSLQAIKLLSLASINKERKL